MGEVKVRHWELVRVRKQAYRRLKGLAEAGWEGESQAAGERVPPGGFICPGFRQGLISEQ